MSELLKGVVVSKAILEECKEIMEKENLHPTLSIIRVGNNDSDLTYERNIIKKCNELNIEIKQVLFNEDVKEETLSNKIKELNNDQSISAIMMFRPLPKHLDTDKISDLIVPCKDVDGSTSLSLAALFKGKGVGFNPCTAEAVIKLLDYYQIELEGKNVVVVGRSLVIGKPVSILLQDKNATVTMCHSKTQNLQAITKKADIVVTAIGKAEIFTKDYFANNQVIIDVGMNYSQEKEKFVGDVAFDEVSEVVAKITPVPGGVGSITTAILLKHIVEASR